MTELRYGGRGRVTLGRVRLFGLGSGSGKAEYRRIACGVLAACLLSVPSVPAKAQTPADLLILQQQQEELVRRQQLEDSRTQRDEDLRYRPPGRAPAQRLETGQAQPDENCIEIDTIDIVGSTRLSDSLKKAIVGPYEGGCIGLNQINEIVRTTTNLYIDKGYITSRVVIPEQDLEDGSLELQVIEGYTGKIVRGEMADDINLRTSFPGLVGTLLNIRDVEQGLDQINRLQSNNAKMRLLPGDEPGSSIVVVDNKPSRPVSGSIGFDNHGSSGTGEIKGSATLVFDNPLRLNDQLTLTYGRNLEQPSENALSQNYTINYSVPWGYWTLSGGYSNFEYASLLQGEVDSFDTDGDGNTSTLSLSRVLRRDQTSKTTLTGTLTRKDNLNYVEGTKLVSSSRVTTVADITAVHTFFAAGATFTIDGGISHGLPLLGAQDNPEFPGSADDRFLLTHAGASFAKVWDAGAMAFGASSNLTAQMSFDRLPGTEQMSIGGVSTVRGFRNRSVSGVSGFYTRNEVYAILPGTGNEALTDMFGSIRPYLGADFGHVFEQQDIGVVNGATLIGGALGIRAIGGNVNFDVAVGRPIYGPDGFDTDWSVNDFYFKLGMNY